MRYLVDTDWVIDYMQARQPVVRRFEELSPHGIGLSIISLAELFEGMPDAVDQQEATQGLQSFLDDVEEVVPVDDEVCWIFANERRRLRAAGNRLDDRMRDLNIISA